MRFYCAAQSDAVGVLSVREAHGGHGCKGNTRSRRCVMSSITVLAPEKKPGGYATRWAGALVALLVAACFSIPAALGQCALSGTVSTWNVAGNANWSNGSDWNPVGIPNSPSTSVCITNGSSAVTLDINATTADLQLASG